MGSWMLLGSLSAGGTGGFSVIIASGSPSTCYLFSLEDNFFLLISNCLSQFKVLPPIPVRFSFDFWEGMQALSLFQSRVLHWNFHNTLYNQGRQMVKPPIYALNGWHLVLHCLYYEDWVYSFNIYHSSLFLTKIALSFRAVLYYLHFMQLWDAAAAAVISIMMTELGHDYGLVWFPWLKFSY
jgi:hypothetical protein